MRKAKALIILMSIGTVSVSAALPIYSIANKFSETFKKENVNSESVTGSDSVADPEFDHKLDESNQGFEPISILDLKSDLGTVEELSEKAINDLIFQVNGDKLTDKKIYLKAITLKKVKFTVENYSGTFEANFKITNLDKLIKNKDLGKIKNVRSTTIIDKIKEKNTYLEGISFEDEIKFDITGLNVIKASWNDSNANSNDFIELQYTCTSIEGIFWNVDLGQITDLSEKAISNKIKEKNTNIDFIRKVNYTFKFEDASKQSPSNVKVKLYLNNNVISFEESDTINVTYNVKNIELIINTLNLGTIADVSQKTIIEATAAKNYIFKNYMNYQKTVAKTVALKSAALENEALSGRVTVTYTIKNIAGLLLKSTIADVVKYPENTAERDKKIIALIKSSNPILDELNDSAIKVSNFKIGTFTVSDEYISGNSFTLAITGYEGSMNISFRIKRTNVSTAFKVTDLGTIYWINQADLIKIIKQRNGTDFDESQLRYSIPSYTSITISAKTESLSYYSRVAFRYTTNFQKRTGFLLQGAKNGVATSDMFTANQRINIMSSYSEDSEIQIKYAIPNGYNNLAASSNKVLNFYVIVEPTLAAAESRYSPSQLKDRLKDLEIKKNFREIPANGSWTPETEIQLFTFVLSAKSQAMTWNGYACTGDLEQVGAFTHTWYSLARENIAGVDYFKIKIRVTTILTNSIKCNQIYIDISSYVASATITP